MDFKKLVGQFVKQSSWPTLTKDWNPANFYRTGWTWDKFTERLLQQNYFIGAFQYLDQGSEAFLSNVFLAPVIDTTKNYIDFIQRKRVYRARLHMIPMTFPTFLKENNSTAIEKYKQSMIVLMKILGADETVGKKDMEKVLENEIKLVKLSENIFMYNRYKETKGSRFRSNNEYEEITLKELSERHNKNFTQFVNNVFNNTNVKLYETEKVLVPKQVTRMLQEINNMTEREQANLISWRVFSQSAANFMQSGKEEYRNIFKDEKNDATNRTTICLNQIKAFFPQILDDLIINMYIEKEEKDFITNMFHNMKEEFSKMIEEVQWMENVTKNAAKEKLSLLEFEVGAFNNDFRPGLAGSINPGEGEYLSNVRKIGNSFWKQQVASFRREGDVGGTQYDDIQSVKVSELYLGSCINYVMG